MKGAAMHAKSIIGFTAVLVLLSFGPVFPRTIDFDDPSFTEGTELTNQYADGGVGAVFSIEGNETLNPEIAEQGSPLVAYTNDLNDHDPTTVSGLKMLTDPVVQENTGVMNSIRVDFVYPVYEVSLYVIDIDNNEQFILKAFDDGLQVDSQPKGQSDPDTGDAIATLMSVTADEIDYVVLDASESAPEGGGFAIDDFQYSSACDDDEDTYIDESCGGNDCDDSDPLVGPPGLCGDCGASAAASTLGAGTVHGSSDLAKHLAYFLPPIGAVIGLGIWRRKK